MATEQMTIEKKIRQIVATHKRMDGALTLKHVAPVVKDVLTAMGLDKKLNIEQ